MRIAVAATPSVAIPTLEAILKSEHVLAALITQPDRAAGRGKELRATPVSDWAHAHQIPLFKPIEPNDLRDISGSVDCVVTVGYGVILPEAIINLPKYGYINLHFSLLPKWRGAAPVQRAIAAGDSQTGVTVFKLDRGMDTGPIYIEKKFSIPEHFRSAELFESLSQIGATAVLEALDAIDLGTTPKPQVGLESIAPKISKEEARISWLQPSDEILRKIRAFYPAPVAWTNFRGESLRIESAKISSTADLPPGQLRIIDGELHVGTSEGALEITKIIPAGKKSIDVKSWLNGARIQSGEQFE